MTNCVLTWLGTRSQTARAVYDFDPTNADELGFVQGDVLNVVRCGPGLVFMRVVREVWM